MTNPCPPLALDALILTPNETVMGEPDWAIRQAEAAGVIYHCDQGEHCPLGWHKGDSFWHLCEGRTMQDYDAVTDHPWPPLANPCP